MTEQEAQHEFGEYIKDAAFPQSVETSEKIFHTKGLTKREYFAAMAMQGILANPNTSHQIESQYGKIDANDANKILAYTATKLSDALIKALNEIKP